MVWTQVITGLEVDEFAAVRVLDAATCQERRERLQKLGGPPAPKKSGPRRRTGTMRVR